jgi:NAD(P)-dependent dehydrogenase (short-subunit alcohol dehydrogenase family)
MSQLLEGKVALVTGGGRGVGRGIALALARAGAKVMVNDLGAALDGQSDGEQPAQEVVATIRAMGGEAAVDAGSVSDWNAAHRMVQNTVERFGHIDIVVNNAGILRDVMFHRMSEQEFDAVMAVHLKGSFNVSRAAAPFFKEQQSGVYIHMTSTSGLVGNLGQANYSAAKLGIVALSKSIALDMQKFGVRSNAVSPFAWTRMIDSIPVTSPEQQLRVERLKQLDPNKIAPLVVALSSDAAHHVSGQIFGVRNNEIYLFSQPRPVRNAHRSEGWTPDAILESALPMLTSHFYPLDRSADVFNWDPI